MPSKDQRPGQRLGKSHPKRVKIVTWAIGLLMCGGGVFAAYHYTGTTEVEVGVARVRKGDFIISVRTRGDVKSTRSVILKAPQVPQLRIVHLADNGRPVRKGEVVVEFDGVQQEQNVISRTTDVRAADGDIVQAKATQKMDDEADAMSKMSSEYDLERAKLDASKAEVLSAIDGEKNRIQVGVSEGSLETVNASINSHQVGHEADLGRLNQRKDKAVRDMALAQSYLGMMQLKAPNDGIVNVLPNFRSGGSFGQSTPPFKEGDNVWTGAEIAEIPDLSEMYVDLKLEEVDRGKLRLGQMVKVRVDAIPDKEFEAELDYISPIAALVFKGGSTPEKTFPARATMKSLDPRLRPGMSASTEVIIEREPAALLIPLRASFSKDGKPAVYLQKGKDFAVRPIFVGKQNDEDIVVTGGLKEGDMVTLESPAEAAKRAKKKL
ncbi:MAG TPA: efflux RND transporter periplasmic adaptor subunit [Candidatus Acidoferrales bacterium]|jgi:HlyD family secretion protein|nr:efflux RND transporter periplasmic adaptor subunit [Candidatus Acidoferrales bacterium]